MRPAPPSTGFPFTAVVGMDDLQLALILAAVSPAIGGVLIRGEKGTAKSTAVRALTEILPAVDVVPNCRFSCDPANPDPTCPDGPHAAAITTVDNRPGDGGSAAVSPSSRSAASPAPGAPREGITPAEALSPSGEGAPLGHLPGSIASGCCVPTSVSRPARLVELPVGATEDRVLG